MSGTSPGTYLEMSAARRGVRIEMCAGGLLGRRAVSGPSLITGLRQAVCPAYGRLCTVYVRLCPAYVRLCTVYVRPCQVCPPPSTRPGVL